jgi:membrane associated rhomboid family serine protease
MLHLLLLLPAPPTRQFVVRQVLQEASAQAAGGLRIGGMQVGHIAHLAGALAGVLLVWLLSKLPDPDAAK